jgi:hypothetical protein
MRRESREGRPQQDGLISRDPPDELVFTPVSICIFDGNLGFPYTTEAMQRVWDDRRHLGGDPSMQALEEIFTTGEVPISLRYLSPDLRSVLRRPYDVSSQIRHVSHLRQGPQM